jgi:hypothetical protein
MSTGACLEVTIPKFTYRVETSMMKPMWDHFVKPLAHPVGFQDEYVVRDIALWTDYFSTTRPEYRAEFISVECIMPDGSVSIDYYTGSNGEPGGISGSTLKYYETGSMNMLDPNYPGWLFQKYIFENLNYLIYLYKENRQVVEYWEYREYSNSYIRTKLYDSNTCNINDSTMTGPYIISDMSDEAVILEQKDILDTVYSGSTWVYDVYDPLGNPPQDYKEILVGNFVVGDVRGSGTGPGTGPWYNIIGPKNVGMMLYYGDRSTDYITDASFVIQVA